MTRLPVIPAALVTGPGDFMVCAPYRARIFAAACVRRQIAAEGPTETRHGEAARADSRISRADLGLCRGCADGAAVRAVVGEVAPRVPTLPALGRRCGLCRGAGHTARTCSRRAA